MYSVGKQCKGIVSRKTRKKRDSSGQQTANGRKILNIILYKIREGEDWNRLAKNRVQIGAAENTVMNFRLP